MHWLCLKPLCEPNFYVFYIKISIGTQGEVGCKSALNPAVIYSIDRSKAVVPVLVLLFVALRFILRGYLLYVLHCVSVFLCFSVLLALRLPRLGKIELILVFSVFSYVCSICVCLFLSVSSSSWCSGRAAVCDCSIPWTFLLPLFGPRCK